MCILMHCVLLQAIWRRSRRKGFFANNGLSTRRAVFFFVVLFVDAADIVIYIDREDNAQKELPHFLQSSSSSSSTSWWSSSGTPSSSPQCIYNTGRPFFVCAKVCLCRLSKGAESGSRNVMQFIRVFVFIEKVKGRRGWCWYRNQYLTGSADLCNKLYWV